MGHPNRAARGTGSWGTGMQQDVLEHEQGKIDAAYEIAEQLIDQLSLDSPF